MLTFANFMPVRLLIFVVLLAAAAVYPAFATKATTAEATTDHRLRCWQYGRLLFDQAGLSKPDSSSSIALKLHRKRNQASLYLVETDNATCLITQSPASSKATK